MLVAYTCECAGRYPPEPLNDGTALNVHLAIGAIQLLWCGSRHLRTPWCIRAKQSRSLPDCCHPTSGDAPPHPLRRPALPILVIFAYLSASHDIPGPSIRLLIDSWFSFTVLHHFRCRCRLAYLGCLLDLPTEWCVL